MSEQQFDVFLCHNSLEKETVEKIRDQLKEFGIYAWLDKYDFEPFRPWQDQLEEIIPIVKAAAVFIGPSGIGPWADIEMREFLKEFAERKIRMGLVILPGCSDSVIKNVPRFMRSFHWVDFRQEKPDPMQQLIWGITGEKPEGSLQQLEVATAITIQSLNPTSSPLTQQSLEKTSHQPLEIIASDSVEVSLTSEKGIDYTRLQDLLRMDRWKEADKETYLRMLEVADRKDGDWVLSEELLSFPAADLVTIDRLWKKYSNGQFGFSVQQEIYVQCGATLDGKYPGDKIWHEFCTRIGWRAKDLYIYYADVTFNTSAPRGHLSAAWRWGGYRSPRWCGWFAILSHSYP